MNKVYLLLGSNVGSRMEKINQAISLLNNYVGKVILKSSVYETAAWGNTEQGNFLNLALLMETKLSPQEILEQIIFIENKMGRVRKEKWEARIIDIDILLYNEEVIEQENLMIPHPFLHQRKFTLVPLVEIAPNYVHPILEKTVDEILNECKDDLLVEKWNKIG